MPSPLEFIKSDVKAVNIGLSSFAENLSSTGNKSVNLNWRPPAKGDMGLLNKLSQLNMKGDSINRANRLALEKILSAQPVWVDVGSAIDTIPGFTPTTILHAGPPIHWDKMCGPMKGAVIGALIYEGLAKDEEEAVKLAESHKITFAPCHHYSAVGPMSGVISASMPVMVVENKSNGNRAYSNFNGERNRKALSFGAYDKDVQDMLNWQRDTMGPFLKKVINELGEINLKSITSRALQMGDDCHNRLVAATSLLLREMVPTFAKIKLDYEEIQQVSTFMKYNDWFFLNFSMAASKATMDAAHNIPMSTVVTAMARNGTEVGIRVSGMGERWFTYAAPKVKGLYFPGYTEEDANPDLGDSAITETAGIGAFAMACAPAMVKLVGGSVADAINYTRDMREITIGTNPAFTVPLLEFAEVPVGIDVMKVIETGINPVINTGIAHRIKGIGMVGAGIVRMPLECFEKALIDMAELYKDV